nr:TolC family protein [Nitrosomonas nitrosa]
MVNSGAGGNDVAEQRHRAARDFGGAVLLCFAVGCANDPGAADSLLPSLETRLSIDTLTEDSAPYNQLADGLDEKEAVALALRNSPTFRASLADLGIAEADVFDARRPANPTLQLIDPVGTGVLEGAISIPIDLLRRPARVAAAKAILKKATLDQIQAGLALARDVRSQFAVVGAADERATALADDAQALNEISQILQMKAGLGRGTGLDAAVARAAALDRQSDADVAAADARAARTVLSALIGADLGDIKLLPLPIALDPASVPTRDALLKAALETRPDVVAADLAVEAAAKNRSGAFLDVLKPSAYADLGQEKGEDLKASGGGAIDVPIFNQGQGAQKRADSVLKRALAERDGVRLRVNAEIISAHDALVSASAALNRIDSDLIPAAERSAVFTRQSFDLGRAPLADVLTARRALNAAHIKRADAAASLRRSIAALNYSAGRELFATTSAALEKQ